MTPPSTARPTLAAPSDLATDTAVETKWGNDRQVTVNKEVVLVQNKTGVSGRFLGAYSTLTLP